MTDKKLIEDNRALQAIYVTRNQIEMAKPDSKWVSYQKYEALEKKVANYTKRNEKLSRLLKDQTGGVTFNELNQSKDDIRD